MEGNEIIEKHLARTYGAERFKVERLAGDASDRSYFRVKTESGLFSGRATAVAMLLSAPQRDLPFLSMQRLLLEIGVPAPELLGSDLDAGVLLLEDFGDVTLQQAVGRGGPETMRGLYARAIDIMIDIQVKGAARSGEDFPCFALAFDDEKLMWELDFFIENAMRIWKRVEFMPGREAELRGEFGRICRALAAEPRFLCHRDYHSRNIMVKPDGCLGIIDFQDARMGPLQYDLVSLLCDSYVDFTPELQAGLYAQYLKKLPECGGPAPDPDRFSYIYDLMVIQRNLKAAGSFAFLDRVKKMDRYLVRMPDCMSHVRRVFDARPEFSRLRGMLSEYLKELA